VVRIVVAIGVEGIPGYVSVVIARNRWGRVSDRKEFVPSAPCLVDEQDVVE